MVENQNNIRIRQCGIGESPPYHLLLLADPSKEMIDSYLEDAEMYIAESGNNMVGVYVLYPLSPATVEIKNIAIDSPLQGQGIGKILLMSASTMAKEKGFETITIGTSNASIAQLYLYQQQGFEITGIKKNFFLDNYSEPIYENGIQCKHMLMLTKQL
jgi:ribosomal protein S18 acetylase RimI-like enzyme